MKQISLPLVRWFAAVWLLAFSAAGHAGWTALTTPANGNISGAASERIGWGYEIDNTDPLLWLVLTGISADAFQNAVGDAIFDLPVLAPGSQRSVAFDGANGLYGLTWNADALLGFVNFGTFGLSAEWWTADPTAGGQFVRLAQDAQLAFSATVTASPPPTGVPVPQTLALVVLGMTMLALQLRKRAVIGALVS